MIKEHIEFPEHVKGLGSHPLEKCIFAKEKRKGWNCFVKTFAHFYS